MIHTWDVEILQGVIISLMEGVCTWNFHIGGVNYSQLWVKLTWSALFNTELGSGLFYSGAISQEHWVKDCWFHTRVAKIFPRVISPGVEGAFAAAWYRLNHTKGVNIFLDVIFSVLEGFFFLFGIR